jgi:isopenicillin N synthase-like dioxygenase
LRSPELYGNLILKNTVAVMARINKEASSPFFTSIPILDFSQTASVETKPVFIRELRDALLNVGFFYVKNTPLPAEVVTSLMAQTVNVFDMPLEKKLEVAMVNSKHFLGYSPLGAEKTGQMADYREQFDVRFLLSPLEDKDTKPSTFSLAPNCRPLLLTSQCIAMSVVRIR